MQGVGDPFNRLPFKEEREDLHDWYATIAKTRNGSAALSTGEARFYAASKDVLLILRWIRGKKDVFGEAAEDGAWLVAVNRGESAVPFTLDCKEAGRGLYHGSIGPMAAEFIEL